MDRETPQPTASWRESCKKAIIPEVSFLVIENIEDLVYIHYYYRTYPIHIEMQFFPKPPLQRVFGTW